MAFWNQVQQLGEDVSRQLYFVYGVHFPIEVRHSLAELIEEKFKGHPADMDPNNPNLPQKQYIASIVLELVKTLELKAQAVSQTPEEEILRKKLNDAAQNFRLKYTEDPLSLYRIIRDCLCYEHHLVDLARMRTSMRQHLMLDNSVNSSNSNIMEKLSQIQQQTMETEHILKCIEDYQDVFVIKVNDMQRLVDRFNSLYSESVSHHHHTQELERQFHSHKEVLNRDLNQGRSNLIQLSNSFGEKIRATISELSTFQTTILDEELTRWKIDQRLLLDGGTVEGSFLSKRLDVLEGWCQSLAASIWSNRNQLKEIQRLVEPSMSIWSQHRAQFESMLSFLKIEVTQLLSTLISSTFIVETQPPQVMKKQAKLTHIPVVRLLVGGQLNLHMNPPQVKVCVISEEEVKALHSHKSSTKEVLEVSSRAIGKFLNDTRTMNFDKKTGQSTVHFLNLILKGIKRHENKEDSVLDEKSCLYFQCQLNLGEPDLDFNIYTLSLPLVATVHTSQEAQAWATVRWDNVFGEPGRIPFQVTQEVSWFRVAEALSGMFEAINGRGLSEGNLRCIGGKAFSDCYFGTHDFLSWSKFCKEPLPGRSFKFCEWFYAILKLTRDNFRDAWKDGLVHGFVSRKQAETMLSTTPPGTFLLRFSDSVLGSIAISWTHSDGSVLHLDPFNSKDLTKRSLAHQIKDLEHLTFLYPETPTADAFAKYWTSGSSEAVNASPGRPSPYVLRFPKTTIEGLNGNCNRLVTGTDDSSSPPRLDSTPHSPHSMQFGSRFPPNLTGYSSPQSQGNAVDSSMSNNTNTVSHYMDYSSDYTKEPSVENSISPTWNSNECNGALEEREGNAYFPFDIRGFFDDYLSKQRDEASDE